MQRRPREGLSERSHDGASLVAGSFDRLDLQSRRDRCPGDCERGGETQTRVVMPTKSYLSQSERELTFGLGEATEIESLVIAWPGGEEQSVEVSSIDELIEITQP